MLAMRNLILSLALIVTFLCPALAQAPDYYLAEYISSDLWNNYSDSPHVPDLKVRAKDWKSFEPFLKEVKKNANGRPIILDLSVHGIDGVPVCAVGNDKSSYLATVGAIINLIEKYIPAENIRACVFESCFGAETYNGSITPPETLLNPHAKGCLLKPRTKGSPSFKCYGVANFRNIPPCALEQFLHNEFVTLEDLRIYEARPPVRLDKVTEQNMVHFNRFVLIKLLKQDGVFR